MSDMLPIIEQLADAPDHVARARWLLRAPEYVLSRDQVVIGKLLAAVGFREGTAALNAEVAASAAVRRPDGSIPITTRLAREHARIGLAIIAR
ncbi:MAG TPA: hypothetical protein VL100_03595, partial [Croceibacterium sp.]|nr:hypothetical protein [Croceibacterium sp.]